MMHIVVSCPSSAISFALLGAIHRMQDARRSGFKQKDEKDACFCL